MIKLMNDQTLFNSFLLSNAALAISFFEISYISSKSGYIINNLVFQVLYISHANKNEADAHHKVNGAEDKVRAKQRSL